MQTRKFAPTLTGSWLSKKGKHSMNTAKQYLVQVRELKTSSKKWEEWRTVSRSLSGDLAQQDLIEKRRLFSLTPTRKWQLRITKGLIQGWYPIKLIEDIS